MSALAEHLGLSLAATSRMTDQLVRHGLLERRQRKHDRRSVSLLPTARGKAAYRRAYTAAHASLAEQFGAISEQERVLIGRAMKVLERVFGVVNAPRDMDKRSSS